MVNKLLNAVTIELHRTFGDSKYYYVENVKQNLTKPCFTIDMLSPLSRSRSPILYDRVMPIVVHYFTDNKVNPKNDCYKVAEEVIECLEYLPFQDTILRGENINWQIIDDDVLQILMTYRFTTISETNIDEAMGELVENIKHN